MRWISILLIIISISANFAKVDFENHYSTNNSTSLTLKKQSLTKIQYPGDSNIDVTYYKLDIDVTYDKSATNVVYLNGITTIKAKALSNLSSVFFDLQNNMIVNDIKINGANATYTHNDNIITITLNSTLINNEEFMAEITYEGVPDPTGFGYFGYDTEYDAIWTLSEPYGASFWWACKDSPADKPDSADIWITTTTDLTPTSNGSLEDIVDNGNGTHTYKWHESYPIAQYLISMAIAPYEIYEQYYHYSPTDSMQVIHYNFPQNHTQERIDIESETVNMLKVFSEMYGQYPFIKEKYGHAEINLAGGMEHQTLTSIGHFEVGTIAHELAHQWFGDMITCANWENIWLNEGFATYSAALYMEKAHGYDQFMGYVQYNLQSAKGADGPIYVQDITDVFQIFSSTRTYAKGAIVLHMLRGVIGDDNFFETLYQYANDPKVKYGAATTEDFQQIAETVSGMNLNWFFQEWIYGESYPKYFYDYNSSGSNSNYTLEITIDQDLRESRPIFKMPIELVVEYQNGNEESFVVWDSLATQKFNLNLSQEPVDVHFDPNNWLLKDAQRKPTLNQGILLINGASWSEEVRQAYQEKAFWGNSVITFWDLSSVNSGGNYPTTLPQPINDGDFGSEIYNRYSTLIWVSGRSEFSMFNSKDIRNYLHFGGNIILLTQNGRYFVGNKLEDYLGIEWNLTRANLTGYNSNSADLGNIEFTDSQEGINTFSTEFANSSTQLLYESNDGQDGVGAIGGENGKLVVLAGIPENFNHSQLSQNIRTILDEYLGETATSVKGEEELPKNFSVKGVYPNPFNPSTKIEFYNNKLQEIDIIVYDLLGQKVATLADHKQFGQGTQIVTWNAGNFSSGIYFIKVDAGNYHNIRKIVLIK